MWLFYDSYSTIRRVAERVSSPPCDCPVSTAALWKTGQLCRGVRTRQFSMTHSIIGMRHMARRCRPVVSQSPCRRRKTRKTIDEENKRYEKKQSRICILKNSLAFLVGHSAVATVGRLMHNWCDRRMVALLNLHGFIDVGGIRAPRKQCSRVCTTMARQNELRMWSRLSGKSRLWPSNGSLRQLISFFF